MARIFFFISLVVYFALCNIAGFAVALTVAFLLHGICCYRSFEVERDFKTSSAAKSVPVFRTAVINAGILHVVIEPWKFSSEDIPEVSEKISVYEIPFADITSINIGNAIATKNISKIDIGLVSEDRDSYVKSGCPDFINDPILTRMNNGAGRTFGTNLHRVAMEEPYQFIRFVLARSHLLK
jgi:hypothetical protein